MHRVSIVHMHYIQIEREARDGAKAYIRKMLICSGGACGCDSQVRSTRLKHIGIRSDGSPHKNAGGNPQKKVFSQLCGEVIL